MTDQKSNTPVLGREQLCKFLEDNNFPEMAKMVRGSRFYDEGLPMSSGPVHPPTKPLDNGVPLNLTVAINSSLGIGADTGGPSGLPGLPSGDTLEGGDYVMTLNFPEGLHLVALDGGSYAVYKARIADRVCSTNRLYGDDGHLTPEAAKDLIKRAGFDCPSKMDVTAKAREVKNALRKKT